MKNDLGFKTIHPKFKLNGSTHDSVTLRKVAHDLLKAGAVFERHIGNFLLDWLDPNDTVEVKTSGSTGVPKVIRLHKQQMVNSALATADFFDLQAGMNALLCLSAEHIAGKMMLVRAMVSGLELKCIPPSSTPLSRRATDYDFCAMVPLQLSNSIDAIERVKTLIVGGAPLSHQLARKVVDKSTRIYETYGMTETITHVAVRKVESVVKPMRQNFLALPEVRFDQDDRGCLVITAPKIASRPIVTNDVVRLVSGTEFQWLGRYDNVINSGGVKLFPEQIESKLAPYISNSFFVAAMEDETLGQKLVLLIEGTTDIPALEEQLERNNDLSRFERPKNVFSLPKFLETETGKIRRKETFDLLRS